MKFTTSSITAFLALISTPVLAAAGKPPADDNAAGLPKLRVGILKRAAVCERKATVGDVVQVDYTGKLADGTVFDSSLKPGRQPLEFAVGLGQTVPGFDKGVLGMCIGEKRKLVIPPHLGYGSSGAGGVIPPDATLTFVTELKGIKGVQDYVPGDDKEKLKADEQVIKQAVNVGEKGKAGKAAEVADEADEDDEDDEEEEEEEEEEAKSEPVPVDAADKVAEEEEKEKTPASAAAAASESAAKVDVTPEEVAEEAEAEKKAAEKKVEEADGAEPDLEEEVEADTAKPKAAEEEEDDEEDEDDDEDDEEEEVKPKLAKEDL